MSNFSSGHECVTSLTPNFIPAVNLPVCLVSCQDIVNAQSVINIGNLQFLS